VSINYERKQKAGSGREKTGCIFFLIFLVTISVGTCGCIKLMQQSAGSINPQTPESQIPDPIKSVATADPVVPAQKNPPLEPTHPVTPTTPDVFTEAAPILPPDPYPLLHGTRINDTLQTNRYVQYAEFTKTYVLRGNATGLVVNATVLEGPLWIHFDIKPLYDCLEDPESCRGELAKSVNRPYFSLTVRDNQTRAIVAEDGYGREYSSQKTNRTIKIYGEGRYHLTLTGNSVDVTLAVATGAAPPLPDSQFPSAGTAPTTPMSPEYLDYLRESGVEI